MTKHKFVALLTVAAMFYWTPSVLPVVHFNEQASASPPCGVSSNYTTWDSAFAQGSPCFVGGSSATHAWPVVVMIAGVASIMFNAAIVWNTQCRELTLEEALTAGALPGVGIAINQSKGSKSACKH